MDANTLGARLQEAREAQGVSRETLAARLGVSYDTLGAIERGVTRNPRFATVVALATALEVTPCWLLTGQRDPGTDRFIQAAAALSPHSARVRYLSAAVVTFCAQNGFAMPVRRLGAARLYPIGTFRDRDR
jgi:transcriptional regulator with XRE-family HTH domain